VGDMMLALPGVPLCLPQLLGHSRQCMSSISSAGCVGNSHCEHCGLKAIEEHAWRTYKSCSMLSLPWHTSAKKGSCSVIAGCPYQTVCRTDS